MRSDGNSKPLFIAGPLHWRKAAQQLGLNEVMLIDAHRNVEMTPAMQDRIAAANPGNPVDRATHPPTR